MHSDGAKIHYLGRISEKLFLGRPDAYEKMEEEEGRRYLYCTRETFWEAAIM